MRIDAVKGVDLCFPAGAFFLVGKSGSGKSTLLNLLGGLEKPTSGEVVYEGRALSAMSSRELDEYRARTVSFVFQEKNVFPALTVAENITFSDASAHPQRPWKSWASAGSWRERSTNFRAVSCSASPSRGRSSADAATACRRAHGQSRPRRLGSSFPFERTFL